jgi:tyrosine-protein phosphatase non-receptor type 4
VILQNSDNGDYINANYVNMEIPGGAITRYIATQGPLNTTVTDFWRMVQQESSHLIVMLTTVVERGRPKCHQYWPSAGEVLEMTEGFTLKCLKEQADETGSFVFRDFVLSDSRTSEERAIQHMQYLVWPDHGVPVDVKLFLEFTQKVRSARSKSLLQEIDDSLKNVKLIDADDDENEVGERWINGDSPNELPVTTSIHQ